MQFFHVWFHRPHLEKALSPYKIVLEMADVRRKEMGIVNIQSLLQDMVEQCALKYKN